jgi:hypothetical protein
VFHLVLVRAQGGRAVGYLKVTEVEDLLNKPMGDFKINKTWASATICLKVGLTIWNQVVPSCLDLLMSRDTQSIGQTIGTAEGPGKSMVMTHGDQKNSQGHTMELIKGKDNRAGIQVLLWPMLITGPTLDSLKKKKTELSTTHLSSTTICLHIFSNLSTLLPT